MGMKYTKVAADTFQKLALNAGLMCRKFVPATGAVSQILGATSGGVSFASNPTYTDFGEDIDNVPANTKQMKQITSFDPALSGTLLTIDAETGKLLVASADIDENDETHIIPRSQLKLSDFVDIWWVGDYSDVNTGSSAGYIAIHIKDALNVTGLQTQSGKNTKTTLPFEFHGHYDIEDEDQEPPFEIFVKQGTSADAEPSVKLDKHVLRIVGINNTEDLTAAVVPAGSTVTWTSASTTVATVSGGTVTAKAAGNTIITASITVGGVTYSDTCTVIITAS